MNSVRNSTKPTCPQSSARKTQQARVLRLLIEAHGEWVSLPEILALGIAQYNARIFELRRLGFLVENRTETDTRMGARHSWFRLLNPSASVAPSDPKIAPVSLLAKSADWYESTTGKPRPIDPPLGPGPLFGSAAR